MASIRWEILNFPNKGVTFSREINSFQWGMNRGIASMHAPSGVRDCVISSKMDEFSPSLFREAIHGEGRLMTFYFRTGTGRTTHTYMTVELENVMITSYNPSTPSADGVPSDGNVMFKLR